MDDAMVEGVDPTHRGLAHYTLSAHLLERDDLIRRLGGGMPARLPAVLLGKLAIAASRQGKGLSGQVLAEAIPRDAPVRRRESQQATDGP